ncbi:MAG: hypothetical protein K6F53_09595 [Lachnospiraceae bacterium]|nr:hypothetical protein [Lachnospiraceae bacterium]
MNDQDRRAVENMARCGLGQEALLSAFPSFPKEEIVRIFEEIKNEAEHFDDPGSGIKLNCS